MNKIYITKVSATYVWKENSTTENCVIHDWHPLIKLEETYWIEDCPNLVNYKNKIDEWGREGWDHGKYIVRKDKKDEYERYTRKHTALRGFLENPTIETLQTISDDLGYPLIFNDKIIYDNMKPFDPSNYSKWKYVYGITIYDDYIE